MHVTRILSFSTVFSNVSKRGIVILTTSQLLSEIAFNLDLAKILLLATRVNPLPDEKILDWSKLKEIADNILKCIESEKKVSYRVENMVRKGDIACYKQFLLFSQCFLQL